MTQIAKFVVDGLWWIGILLNGVTALWVFGGPAFMKKAGLGNVDLGAPVRISFEGGFMRSPLSTALTPVDTARASGPHLHFERAHLDFDRIDAGFQFLLSASLLLRVAALLFGIYLVRSFLADILHEKTFTEKNANRLAALGWLVIAFGVVWSLVQNWRAGMMLEQVRMAGAVLTPGGAGWMVPATVGLLILVLSAAWRYGAELQQERDHTL